ncbi:MAG: tetratricopeptide repeat protein [Thalassotalea sp.]
MKKPKQLLCLLCLVLSIVGCQSIPIVYQPQQVAESQTLLADEKFPSYQLKTIETEQIIFQLSPEMIKLVETNIKPFSPLNHQVKDLVNLIFDEQQIGLSYQNLANLTAEQTFRSREANCISLTVMAYALAKQAGLNVSFQDVKVPEYWIRNGKYSLLTGHVNLVITQSYLENIEYIYHPQTLIIDFDPQISKKQFPSKKINKQRIIAMFYTNKGAQAMIERNYDLAYAYLKAAVVKSPTYSPAWGNLGILYRLIEENTLAIQTYEYAISLNNKNYTAATNLAILFKKLGRLADADNIQQQLHALRLKNPYYHTLLGENAFYRGAYIDALASYKQAIRLDSKQHEFYFGISKVYYELGENFEAQKALKKAIRYNKYDAVAEQYVAKLNYLRAN